MSKKKIAVIMSFLILIFILGIFGVYFTTGENVTKNAGILEDLEYLFDSIESTHPAFFLDEVPKEYYIEKANLQKNTLELEEGPEVFKFKIAKLLSTFNDLHTGLGYSALKYQYLDTRLYYLEDKLRLVEGENITDFYLSKINNINISRVLKFIEETFPAENDIGKAINFEDYSRNIDVLKYLGIDVNNNIELIFIDINNENNLQIMDSKFKEKIFEYTSNSMECSLVDDIILFDINSFNLDDYFKESISLLEKYIGKGYTKVLIDVRNCPGGNSIVTDEIFKHLGVTGPDVGVYYPASKKLMENQGDFFSQDMVASLLKDGFWEFKPSYQNAEANDRIELVIMINKYSASSSMDMALRIQDGRLGTVIGEISCNSPNLYGDIGAFTLPNSNLDYSISLKKWFRPDQNADHKNLIPDIITNYDDDIFKIALDFLNSKYK